MKYYRYFDEECEIGSGIRYVETDDNYAVREVTLNGEVCLASNILYPHWRMFLGEGRCDYDDLQEVTPISKSEFDEAWQKNLTQTAARWLLAKSAYPIGNSVDGAIVLFYPQGVIVDLGGAVGIADYRACRNSTKPEFMYPRHKVTAVIKDYDESNQWIVLGSPKVHAERIAEFRW